MNALANEKVGDYLNEHFASATQKVGTFRVVNGRKQGGNVAGYFCRPDGTVLHAVPGPVGADVLLREARWAVEVHNLAAAEGDADPTRFRRVVRKAHLDRLRGEHRLRLDPEDLPGLTADPPAVTGVSLRRPEVAGRGDRAEAHVLLAATPLPRLEGLYPVVWEQVLNERLSTAPVQVVPRK